MPDYWTIGEVYERLIEDVAGDDAEHMLGHSSIETMRIYLISTGAERARDLERLGLIS